MPTDCVGGNQISKEFSDISKTIGFVTMDCGVVCFKGLFEGFLPISIEVTESFTHETVESGECTFLGTTFYNHVD